MSLRVHCNYSDWLVGLGSVSGERPLQDFAVIHPFIPFLVRALDLEALQNCIGSPPIFSGFGKGLSVVHMRLNHTSCLKPKP